MRGGGEVGAATDNAERVGGGNALRSGRQIRYVDAGETLNNSALYTLLFQPRAPTQTASHKPHTSSRFQVHKFAALPGEVAAWPPPCR